MSRGLCRTVTQTQGRVNEILGKLFELGPTSISAPGCRCATVHVLRESCLVEVSRSSLGIGVHSLSPSARLGAPQLAAWNQKEAYPL